MAKKQSCRSIVFDTPIPDFSGGFPNESEVVRVYFWCEKNAKTDTSPSQILDDVTIKLRAHWESLDKKVMDHKQVKEKINQLVKKVARKVDGCTISFHWTCHIPKVAKMSNLGSLLYPLETSNAAQNKKTKFQSSGIIFRQFVP